MIRIASEGSTMTKPKATILLITALVVSAASARAGGFELSAHLGRSLPTYDKTFTYDPGLAISTLPGVTVTQDGSFTLNADGGLAVGGAATFYFVGILGLEARLDTADVNINVTNPVFHVNADLPPPLPDLSQDLALAQGTADLGRLHPFSLNLKLR